MLHQLARILSADHVTASCPRILTFGGNCECNYREPKSGNDADIRFDMHLYGQRRVCIADGYLSSTAGAPCRVLSVQAGRYNGDPSALGTQLAEFGCASNGYKAMYSDDRRAARRFSLRRELRQLGDTHLDLLDVSVAGMERDVLWDLLRPAAKVSAAQVALVVVLAEDAIESDEPRPPFTLAVARGYLKLLTRLEEVGYRMLSFKPHPKCVEAVQKEHNICLPVLANTVWIK